MTRAFILSLLLLGTLAADQIRLDYRAGDTGNFAPRNLTTLPDYVITFNAAGEPIIGPATAGVTDGNKGDISVTGSGANWVINPAAITLGKLADLAQAKLIGRWTASTGVPEAITIGADFLTTGGTLSLAVAPQPLNAHLTDLSDGSLTGSKVGTGISGDNITTGTVLDARIDAAIARDSEVTAAIATAGAGYQPLNANLTDLAGLTAAQGDILIGNGAGDWEKLIKGTASQTLRMNAGATLPEWATVSGGGDVTQAGNNAFTGNNTFAGTGVISTAGAADTPALKLTGTPFAGTATTSKALVLIEPTGATSTAWGTTGNMLGVNAATGFAGNLINAQLNGVARFSVASSGDIIGSNNVYAGGPGAFAWAGRGFMQCPSNGVIIFYNAGFSDFNRLQLGGTTAAFPSIKRNTTAINIRLADDSADAPITAAAGTFSGPVTLRGYTVATLPAGTIGMTAYVTDATAPTYLGTLTGGGAVKCPVFYNGTAWVSH